MEKGKKFYRINEIAYSKPVEIIGVLLVLVSLSFLFYQKLADITPWQREILDHIDFVIMLYFAIGFFVKLRLQGRRYFLNDYGWIDLLSILPLFSPALRAMRGIKLVRSLRILRALRILRFLRILKVTRFSQSRLKQKMFVPVSSAVMIIGLVISFSLGLWQQSLYGDFEYERLEASFNDFDENNPEKTIRIYPDILLIYSEENEIYRKYSDNEISQTFIDEYLWKVSWSLIRSILRLN